MPSAGDLLLSRTRQGSGAELPVSRQATGTTFYTRSPRGCEPSLAFGRYLVASCGGARQARRCWREVRDRRMLALDLLSPGPGAALSLAWRAGRLNVMRGGRFTSIRPDETTGGDFAGPSPNQLLLHLPGRGTRRLARSADTSPLTSRRSKELTLNAQKRWTYSSATAQTRTMKGGCSADWTPFRGGSPVKLFRRVGAKGGSDFTTPNDRITSVLEHAA